MTLDPDTLHWLGSPELDRACHAAVARGLSASHPGLPMPAATAY